MNYDETKVTDPEFEDSKFALSQSNDLASMLNTPGWVDVLRPALEQRRDALTRKILDVTEHKDFIQTQQAINAINNIFVFIDNIIQRGQVAAEYMKKEKQ